MQRAAPTRNNASRRHQRTFRPFSDHQWRLVAAAISLGGNVRVGLEDNFYVAPGRMAASNGELVEKAVRMIRDQGREPASLEEARRRLGLRGER